MILEGASWGLTGWVGRYLGEISTDEMQEVNAGGISEEIERQDLELSLLFRYGNGLITLPLLSELKGINFRRLS